MSIPTITPKELFDRAQRGEAIELIDVRTPVEFRELHPTIAKNVPLSELNPQQIMQARNGVADKPLYFICRSGNRAAKACEKFMAAGYSQVVNVKGGTNAWQAADLPVRRGEKAMSLERQVRIAAGFLVLCGAMLGYFVHPAWIALSAFVGAGLMFAGITDTCGMAMLLARMPWNQVRSHQQCSTS